MRAGGQKKESSWFAAECRFEPTTRVDLEVFEWFAPCEVLLGFRWWVRSPTTVVPVKPERFTEAEALWERPAKAARRTYGPKCVVNIEQNTDSSEVDSSERGGNPLTAGKRTTSAPAGSAGLASCHGRARFGRRSTGRGSPRRHAPEFQGIAAKNSLFRGTAFSCP